MMSATRVKAHWKTVLSLAALALLASAGQGCSPRAAAAAEHEPPLLVMVDVANTWNGAESASLREISRMHPVVPTFEALELDKLTGFSLDQVNRFAGMITDEDLGVVALEMTRPYDRAKVLRTLTAGGAEKKARGRTYFVGGNDFAVLPLTDRLLVISSGESMPKLLAATIDSRPAIEYLHGILSALPAEVRFRMTILPPPPGQPIGGAGTFQRLPLMLNADRCEILIEANNSLKATLRAEYDDNDKATASGDKTLDFIQVLDQVLALGATEFPKFLTMQEREYPQSKQLTIRLSEAIKEARAALKATTLQVEGNAVEAHATINTAQPVTKALLLMMLMPRPKKAPGE